MIRPRVGIEPHSTDNHTRALAVFGDPIEKIEHRECLYSLSMISRFRMKFGPGPIQFERLEHDRSDVNLFVSKVSAEPLTERAAISHVLRQTPQGPGTSPGLPHVSSSQSRREHAVDETRSLSDPRIAESCRIHAA